MKKAFFALFFLSCAGAGVLFWLMKSSSHDDKTMVEAPPAEHGDKEHGEEGGEHGEAHAKEEGAEHEAKDAKLSEEDSHESVASEHDAAPTHGEAATPPVAAHAGEDAEGETPDHGEEPGAPPPAGASDEAGEEADKAPPSLTIHTEPPAAKVWVDGKPRGETPVEIPLLPKAQMVQIEADGYAEFTRLAPSDKEAGSGQLNWKIQLKEGKSGGKVSHHAAPKVKSHAAAPKAKPAAPKVVAKHAEAPAHGSAQPAPQAATSHSAPEAAKEAPQAHTEPAAKGAVSAARGLKTGRVGPYLIQMQSIRREGAWANEVNEALARSPASSSGAFGCRVKLPDGTEWVRILAGPFGSKAEAQERLTELRKQQPEAFVAKTQKCLP